MRGGSHKTKPINVGRVWCPYILPRFQLRPSATVICYSAKTMFLSIEKVVRCLFAFFLVIVSFLLGHTLSAQQSATQPPAAPHLKVDREEFATAADEVLEQVSEITGLKQLTPLKKTLRSRDEIRAYVIREMDDEKNPTERYGEERSAEAFGLIPKGFDLD